MKKQLKNPNARIIITTIQKLDRFIGRNSGHIIFASLVTELLEKFPIGEKIVGEQNQDVQDYHSMYIDLYNEFRKGAAVDQENINDDLVFEMELIKQVEITLPEDNDQIFASQYKTILPDKEAFIELL